MSPDTGPSTEIRLDTRAPPPRPRRLRWCRCG